MQQKLEVKPRPQILRSLMVRPVKTVNFVNQFSRRTNLLTDLLYMPREKVTRIKYFSAIVNICCAVTSALVTL